MCFAVKAMQATIPLTNRSIHYLFTIHYSSNLQKWASKVERDFSIFLLSKKHSSTHRKLVDYLLLLDGKALLWPHPFLNTFPPLCLICNLITLIFPHSFSFLYTKVLSVKLLSCHIQVCVHVEAHTPGASH